MLTSRDARMFSVSPGLNIRSAVTRPSAVTRTQEVSFADNRMESGERGSGIGVRTAVEAESRAAGLDAAAAAADVSVCGLSLPDGQNIQTPVPIKASAPNDAAAATSARIGNRG